MNNVEIGNRIKQRRKELGLTQVQIYEATGISSGNLSTIENGKSLPSSAALISLSNLLQCTIDYLLKGASSISEISNFSDIEESISKSATDNKLLNAFHQLDFEDQDEILAMIDLKIQRKEKRRKSLNSNTDQATIIA